MADQGTAPEKLRARAEAADIWLFTTAMPLWLERGVDRRLGGFHESLTQDGSPDSTDFKRLRVTTRQVYVFAEGARHNVSGAREAVDHGLDFIRTRMRHWDGGYASRCDIAGRITDPTRDLYDLAFVLFAFAHAFRSNGDQALRDDALALVDFIAAALRHPAGGFCEGVPHRLPRRQNPHMHLLEAALACVEYMPHPDFDKLCHELADLCRDRLLDSHLGLLPEYYSEDWQPERPNGHALIEPGHHMEWAWLLAELERLLGRHEEGGTALARFALRHGLDQDTGLLRGSILENGVVADGSVRLWPHCEWLKAALVTGGAAGDPATAWDAMSRFLKTPLPGLWFERWDVATRAFAPSASPASSLYHIVSAITALRRYSA